jgi:hypothetical protein
MHNNMAAKVLLFFHYAKFYIKYKCSKSQQGALIAYFETIFADFESRGSRNFCPHLLKLTYPFKNEIFLRLSLGRTAK